MIGTEQADIFLQLREIASTHGAPIQPAGTPYIGDGELRILSWIAAAQRVDGWRLMPLNHALAAIVKRCAEILAALRLRLPSLTVYRGLLRQHSAG